MRALLLLIGIALSAYAVPPAAADDTLAEIARCRGIASAAERLACYDRAAQRAADPAAPQPKASAAPKPEHFGKPAPRPVELSQLSAAVKEFHKTARGRAVFVLDNGQVWRQIDGDSTAILEPEPGEVLRVTIARGLLGSYDLSIEGRNAAIKVRRVQ